MKITAIKVQEKNNKRFSVFIDNSYAFSLSESGLLESGIFKGQEVSEKEKDEFTQLSDVDTLYARTIRFVAIRARSEWEIRHYLMRKGASPTLIDRLLSKLSKVQLINDEKYARAYINDRLLLRPTSRRKLKFELMKKHISDEILQRVLSEIQTTDSSVLEELIAKKRQQSIYQDDQKLMQYLARQGFFYGDIKNAMETKS